MVYIRQEKQYLGCGTVVKNFIGVTLPLRDRRIDLSRNYSIQNPLSKPLPLSGIPHRICFSGLYGVLAEPLNSGPLNAVEEVHLS
jgi:hypothetical protein